MRVQSFTFESDAVARFVGLAWELRQGDPRWIPPIRDSLRASLSQANPFYRHGRVRNFLASRDGREVGRCSAIIDERLAADGGLVGMVGLFEVEKRYATAEALLDEALGWLRRQGVSAVWGPLDFSIFNGYRFKTQGFDRATFQGEPDNPPEYPEYFARYGFQVLERFTAWDLNQEQLRAFQEQEKAAAEDRGVTDRGYTYRPFDMARFDQEVRTLYELVVGSFDGHTAYVPISYEEFAFWNRGARLLMEPSTTQIVMAPDGEVVGASYNHPDWAPLMRRLNGDLEPNRLDDHRQEVDVDRIVVHTDVVVPGHRRRGLIHGALGRALEAARSRGYTRGVTGLAKLEELVWGEILSGAERVREYAIYRLEL